MELIHIYAIYVIINLRLIKRKLTILVEKALCNIPDIYTQACPHNVFEANQNIAWVYIFNVHNDKR